MNIWYRVALGCWLIPLFTGVGIFIAWLLTHYDWLMLAGYFTVLGGVLLFFVGLAALFIAARRFKKQGFAYKKKILLVLFLLFANFPVAFGMSAYVLHLVTVFNVIVKNDSDKLVERIVFIDPLGRIYDMSKIFPGTELRHQFRFKGEGSVSYSIKVDGQTDKSGILIGYTTSGMGSDVMVKILPDGSVRISEFFGNR